jgi:hypothetical protein
MLSVCVIKQHALTAWCVELQLHAFFNFTRDGGDW